MLPLNYNVDCLEFIGGSDDQLVAGVSNFAGQFWTGGVALLSTRAQGAPVLQQLVQLRTGVPAIAVLEVADAFTSERPPPCPPLPLSFPLPSHISAPAPAAEQHATPLHVHALPLKSHSSAFPAQAVACSPPAATTAL